MTENFVPKEAGRSAENKLEAVNEKVVYTKLLIDIGAIEPTGDVSDEMFARVSEIASLPDIDTPVMAMNVAALEVLTEKLAGNAELLSETLDEVKEELNEIIENLAGYPEFSEESLAIIRTQLVTHMNSGEKFFPALSEAISQRLEFIDSTPEFTVVVNQADGLVSRDNPRFVTQDEPRLNQ